MACEAYRTVHQNCPSKWKTNTFLFHIALAFYFCDTQVFQVLFSRISAVRELESGPYTPLETLVLCVVQNGADIISVTTGLIPISLYASVFTCALYLHFAWSSYFILQVI